MTPVADIGIRVNGRRIKRAWSPISGRNPEAPAPRPETGEGEVLKDANYGLFS
jgi:hypothetical protein